VSVNKKRKLSLVSLVLPHWKTFAVGIVAVLVEASMDLLQPWPLKIVIDLVGSKPMPAWLGSWVALIFGTNRLAVLNFVAVSVIVIALMDAVSSYAESLSMTTVGQWVTHDLRSTLYNHIQRLSLSYHDKSQTGDLISRVTSDIDTIQGFITSTLTDVVLDILNLTSMLAVMSYIDWRFTLIALSVAPFMLVFVYNYSHRIKKASRAVRKKESEIVSQTQEVFSSIRVVKAFAQEKYEKRRFREVSLETVELALRARALKAGLSPGIRVMTALATALMMW
jgi:ATP-binding cassette subfamily B protein